jgi:hypothetical protein
VVPSSYREFMITSAGAAGALIGLLFVVISLRSSYVFGPKARTRVRALAGSCFTGLVNAFSLSLLAIIPNTNIGRAMIVLAVACLYNTLKLHHQLANVEKQYRILIVSCLTYLCQGVGGVALLVRPHTVWIVNGLCYVIFASFALALYRAWMLIQAEAPTTSAVDF